MLKEGILTMDTKNSGITVLKEWWRTLHDKNVHQEQFSKNFHAAERAVLRRCESIEAIQFTAPFYGLLSKMQGKYYTNEDSLAVIAGLFPYIKNDTDSEKFGNLLAGYKQKTSQVASEQKPIISDLRFRRLLSTGSNNLLLISLRRVLKQIEGSAPLTTEFIDLIYYWNHPIKADKVKRKLAKEYYLTIQS